MANYEQTIWNYFKSKLGNEYGTAALMGNLFAESGLQPNNLQNSYESSLGFTDESYTAAVDNGSYSEYNFVHDSAGYGLAQWTYYSRKQGLYDMYKSGGYSSIGSINLALDYLYYELQNSYPTVLAALKSATSIRAASDVVLHDFESPKDQSESVEILRASYGAGYYNTYTGSGGGSEGGGSEGGGSQGGSGTITTKKRKGYKWVLFNPNKRKRFY